MLATILAASLITTPTTAGRPEAECLREFAGDWHQIADCIAPPVNLEDHPDLKQALDACKRVIHAADSAGATLVRATITVAGMDTECTGNVR